MGLSWAKHRGTLLMGVALFLVTLAAWIGVLRQVGLTGPGTMPMDSMAMDGADPYLSLGAALTFVAVWLVMMAAMMLPSATPMVLLYHTVAGRQAAPGNPAILTGVFIAGYLLVWSGFGLVDYLAQTSLAMAADSNITIASALPFGAAAVLVLGGIYQFTPLKSFCLRQCRSPMDFLMLRWRSDGLAGALRLGVEHGVYCLGCCWGLMAVLAAAGAMGLAWVTVIALVVFVEKLLPWGEAMARLVGVLLLGLGVAVALRPELVALLQATPMGGTVMPMS